MRDARLGIDIEGGEDVRAPHLVRRRLPYSAMLSSVIRKGTDIEIVERLRGIDRVGILLARHARPGERKIQPSAKRYEHRDGEK